MTTRSVAIGMVLFITLVAGAYGLYRAGISVGRNEVPGIADVASQPPEMAGAINAESGKEVLYWHDPMVPGQRFDKPGKSPFMDMELVPVYAEPGDGGGITIDPRIQQNLGIRVAEVTRGMVRTDVSAVGSVAYNERDSAVVQARADGFVERLHVRALLDRVTAGQPLAELYIPAWVAAQEEYLSVRSLQSDARLQLVDGARQRMRLAGMTADQVALVEASGIVQARLTIKAPIDGVITELAAREGMTITTGTPLFRINGLATVWVDAELPESAFTEVRQGQGVQATVAALPGSVFHGKISAILPEVNLATRTLKARVELANSNGNLMPGMFATLRFTADPGRDVLQVPSEAVIQTGTRTVVMLATDGGRFQAVEVETGVEHAGQTEIRSGLMAGQKVVVSGQFLVDSEASLRATESRLSDGGGPP